MKIEMDEKGCLCISGDTPIESFALTKWYEEWANGRCNFLVRCVEHATDGSGALDRTFRHVTAAQQKDTHAT